MSRGQDDRPGSEIVFYQGEGQRGRILVRLEEETVWLTQVAMADLYQTTVANINIHIKNILGDAELTEGATIKDYLIVRQEGLREVQRSVKHYNLDMILAVGYRVRSPRGVQFRQWADLGDAVSRIEHGPSRKILSILPHPYILLPPGGRE